MDKLSLFEKAYLNYLFYLNKLRFARLKYSLAGRVEFGDGCDLSIKNLSYKGKGKIIFGKDNKAERGDFPLVFETEKNSEIVFGDRVGFRCKYCSNVFTIYEGARIEVGDDAFFNGSIINAKNRIKIGKKSLLSWHVSVMDSDLHDLSNTRKERVKSVEIGDYVLVGTGTVILAGVKIGSHCVIGSNSVVSKDIPDHSIAVGAPCKVVGAVDDRDQAR